MSRLTVTGWTSYDNRKYEDTDLSTDRKFRRAFNAAVKNIKDNGLSFSGEYHQYGKNGAPVLSDGTVLRVSQRTWGRIMATAHSKTDEMDYVHWYIGPVENEKFPQKEKK